MVRVVEGICCAVVRGIVEIPRRRSLVPDELIELVEIFRAAGLADFSGEIVLVPECECSLGRPRCLVARRAANLIVADGNDCLSAFRPKHRHGVRCARAPFKASDCKRSEHMGYIRSITPWYRSRQSADVRRCRHHVPCGAGQLTQRSCSDVSCSEELFTMYRRRMNMAA